MSYVSCFLHKLIEKQMSLAILEIGYAQAKKLLKQSDLLLDENYSRDLNFSSSKFSDDFFAASKENDYQEIYRIAYENKDYDFLLKDYSFLQFSGDFSSDEDVYRYAYYEVPTNFPTYEEYLVGNDLSYEECGEAFRQEYEQVADEGKLKNAVMPIRLTMTASIISHLIIQFHISTLGLGIKLDYQLIN